VTVPPCPPSPAPGVVVCLAATTVLTTVAIPSADLADGPSYDVAGYLDTYRFALPAGGSVSIPCVRLGVNSTTVSACETAGGALVSRETLVDVPLAVPVPGEPRASVTVCNALLTVTVDDFGSPDLPAATLCRSSARDHAHARAR